jgi:hypothetical protein
MRFVLMSYLSTFITKNFPLSLWKTNLLLYRDECMAYYVDGPSNQIFWMYRLYNKFA